MSRVLAEFGPIHILINNVGGRRINVPTEQLPLEDWQRIIDLNVTSTFLCCKIIGGEMLKRKSGRIINIASIAGIIASKGIYGRTYETAKGAIMSFTKALAVDWAAHNVTVNAIAPGTFLTEPESPLVPRDAGTREDFLEPGANGTARATRRDRPPRPLPRQRRLQLHDRHDAGHRRRLHGVVTKRAPGSNQELLQRIPYLVRKSQTLAAHQRELPGLVLANVDLAVEDGPVVGPANVNQPPPRSERHAEASGGVCGSSLLLPLGVGADKHEPSPCVRSVIATNHFPFQIRRRQGDDAIELDPGRRAGRGRSRAFRKRLQRATRSRAASGCPAKADSNGRRVGFRCRAPDSRLFADCRCRGSPLLGHRRRGRHRRSRGWRITRGGRRRGDCTSVGQQGGGGGAQHVVTGSQ